MVNLERTLLEIDCRTARAGDHRQRQRGCVLKVERALQEIDCCGAGCARSDPWHRCCARSPPALARELQGSQRRLNRFGVLGRLRH